MDGFGELAKLIANLEQLGSKGSEAIGEKLAPAIQAVLEQQYTDGKGPDGQQWADKADGTPSFLQKTGAMRSGTNAVAGVKGVSVRIPSPGGFHQGGTVKMPERKLVPDGELEGEWAKAAEEAVRAAITESLTK